MCGVFGTSPCGGEAAWKDIHTCTVERYTEATVEINKANPPPLPHCDPVDVNPISGQLISGQLISGQLMVCKLWVWKGIGFLSGYRCSLVPRPHPLTRRNGLVNQVEFLGLTGALATV